MAPTPPRAAPQRPSKRPARGVLGPMRPGTLAPLQPAEMAARHKAAEPVATDDAPPPGNLQAALELGDIAYVTFRGRPFGVPPVPLRLGQNLLMLWTEARRYASPLTHATAPKYYAAINQLPALLWAHARPCGRLMRSLKAMGLLRNPFRDATEQELLELAAFFLSRRRQSSIGVQPATPPIARAI